MSLPWSGFTNTQRGGPTAYSKVLGSWTEPSIRCTQSEGIALFWVGIDGYTSQTVEQAGSIALCNSGNAYYGTWWEMYPTTSVIVVGQAAAPGDKITASVRVEGTSYTLRVADATHPKNSFTTVQTCSTCENSSAEWIAERPESGGQLVYLPDFGKIRFHGAAVRAGSDSGTIGSLPHDKVTMVNQNGQVLVHVRRLQCNGGAFVATWRRGA